MPTYLNHCLACGHEDTAWQSIHDDTHPPCYECGKATVRKIDRVVTYGVGERGAATREADAMDARIDEARPSYKRLRDAGMQPTSVLDSPRLERHGDDPMYVESGGQVAVPEHRRDEIREMMSAAKYGDWNPVDQVHEERSSS